MNDPIAEFLARGGKVKYCPAACVAASSAIPSRKDQRRLARHFADQETVRAERTARENLRLSLGWREAPSK